MIRSSVVPQTIARETAQNANWKKNFASMVASESDITGKSGRNPASLTTGPRSVRKNPPSWPMKPPSGPLNANANPTAHQQRAAIEKFVRIFAITVPAFLALEKPISRNAKPACMKNTKQAATITHSELIPTVFESPPSMASCRSPSAPNAAEGRTSNAPSPANSPRYLRFISVYLRPRIRPGPNTGKRRAPLGGRGSQNPDPN